MSAYALPGLFPPLSYGYEVSKPAGPSSDKDSSKSILGESRSEDQNQSFSEPRKSAVGIAVKEAKVDSAMLVQSIAKGTSSASTSPNARRRVRNRNGENMGKAEEEALQFELSISIGGRKFTTTRSWPMICRLRKDLMRSLQSCEIPELPSLHPPGALCRSLSFMHDLVKSYVPSLEGWLRTVADLVPQDNPILSHFLYEEFEEENNSYTPTASPALEKQLEERSKSFTNLKLYAIDETEYDEDDLDEF